MYLSERTSGGRETQVVHHAKVGPQFRQHKQRLDEMLDVAPRIEGEHARLERSRLTGGAAPDSRPPGFVPRLVSDDERVDSGDTDFGERINDVVIKCKVRADGEVDTAAWRERFGVVRPDDRTLFHVEGCTACHALHGNSLDFHVLEYADEGKVGLNSVSLEMQVVHLEELGESVDLGAHLADIHLENDEGTEYGRELGLGEVINPIGRRELHVSEVVVRAAPHNVEELAENGAIVTNTLDLERM